MVKIILLLLGLPSPALVTLIVALVCLAFVLLVLIAFVPNTTEKIIALIKALREEKEN